MAWTVKLTNAETNTVSTNVIITLQFTSDSGEVQTRVVPSDTWTDERIAIWAQGAVVGLESRDAILAAQKAKITSGPAAIQLPRDGFQTPNADAANAAQQQAAKIAGLAQQIGQLNTLQAAASAGLIAADDPDLAAAQSAVKATTSAQASSTTSTTAQPASP